MMGKYENKGVVRKQRGRVFILHYVSRMNTRPLCFSKVGSIDDADNFKCVYPDDDDDDGDSDSDCDSDSDSD